MTTSNDQVWKTEALSKWYLEGIRGAIPLAEEQIDLILLVVKQALPKVGRFLDLGCGDGILGQALLSAHPEAEGVFLDFSDIMIRAAKEKVRSANNQAVFIAQDYGSPTWVQAVNQYAPFDVIVSGFSIHHQVDARKREIYGELYNLLAPGGVFLNLEHVASASPWVETVFDECFIEALWGYHAHAGTTKTREQIAQAYHQRPDKEANKLAPVEKQCQWLRDIGFQNVDCYFKLLELALFGGTRSPRPPGP